ncbi:hypothetical protein [Natrinema sp. 1APR25-10V2]|uniref:hypothetical protein n=1 Tax=Natrinema sp. 1APR25-10V2 TaxID=2951081 RepID=UPI0028755DC8|nr:hypothetical protein [Natrinema sp. 1APR25-10V2]MDS0477544.1 hypothetical protein [Natrinema sp. 1APR25-10V2]
MATTFDDRPIEERARDSHFSIRLPGFVGADEMLVSDGVQTETNEMRTFELREARLE